jgi:signal transduction histidine kinase
MAADTVLRILFLEDEPKDAELVQASLEAEGIVCDLTRADTQADFLTYLRQGGFDLILADYTLPLFDGISALRIAQEICSDVPFIFVSGTLGEELAIEALKIGATDYVLKTRLSRLVPSVRRALRETGERTDRKLAEEALQKARTELAHVRRVTALGELTASIAHQINQPLAAVVTNANASLRWLAGDSPNLAEAREAIRRIICDSRRAGDVISGMRALFRKAPETKERLDINEVIEEVLILTQGEAQRNRVALRTELANDLPATLGDRILLQQVVLNLLINAIEAMSGVGEGPRDLSISSQKVTEMPSESEENPLEDKPSAEAESAHILVAVRDSGPGLDPKHFDRLFDAFYTTTPKGLGMGLAICRSIVQAHGGRLWATPNLPRGAAFQFTLPIRER